MVEVDEAIHSPIDEEAVLHRMTTPLTPRQSESARNLGSFLLEHEKTLGDYVSVENAVDFENGGQAGPVLRYRGALPGIRVDILMPSMEHARVDLDAFIISCVGFSLAARRRVSTEGSWKVKVPKDRQQRAVVVHDSLVPSEDAQEYAAEVIGQVFRQANIIARDRELPES